MAILILGQSTCGLCGRVIADQGDSCSFPSFISTQKSLYRNFSGQNFHRVCFEKDKHAADVIALANAFRQGISPQTRVCAIDGQPIIPDDDFIFIEYITDEPSSYLRRNVFKNYRLSNLDGWLELPLLVGAFDDLKRGEKHLQAYADRVLKTINVGLEKSKAEKREQQAKVIAYRFLFTGVSDEAALKYLAAEDVRNTWFLEKMKTAVDVLHTAMYIDSIRLVFRNEEQKHLRNKHNEKNDWLLADFLKLLEKKPDVTLAEITLSTDAVSENSAIMLLEAGDADRPPSLRWKIYTESEKLSELRVMVSAALKAKEA